MKEILEKIQFNPLFNNISIDNLDTMLKCINANVVNFLQNDVIFLAGSPIDMVGIVISGSVNITKEDINGTQTLVAKLGVGELFAEVFACAGIMHSPVSVVCAKNCKIMFIDYKRCIKVCPNSCQFHNQLVSNMLFLVANKAMQLNKKIEILSKRTIRQRLLLYFENECAGTGNLEIPLNREELAAYICVDRSALSAQLSKMQKEGLISYKKNNIEIKQKA